MGRAHRLTETQRLMLLCLGAVLALIAAIVGIAVLAVLAAGG